MTPITSLSQLSLAKTYTYADYLTWQLTELVELVKGHIWKKSPAPKVMHQRYSRRILTKIDAFLAGAQCEVFDAPFDVRLTTGGANGDQQIQTVVQPDICVVCDPVQLADGRGCLGAPALVVEILSASTMAYDTKVKFDLYEESGVAEYWIVSPGERAVAVYVLHESEYQAVGSFYEAGPIPCHTLPKLNLDWNDIFEPAGAASSV